MADYKTINVDMEVYEMIKKLADENGRTLGGQVAVMVRYEVAKKNTMSFLQELKPHMPQAKEDKSGPVYGATEEVA